MSSHIFPVKLHGLMSALHQTNMLTKRRSPPGITNDPEDGLERIMLFTSEVHKATAAYLNDDSLTLRKRLAFPPRGSSLGIQVEQTAFEIYNVEGTLIATSPVCKLERAMSLAIEVELMSLLLEGNGIKIDMV